MLHQALDTGFKVTLNGSPLQEAYYADLEETAIELDGSRPDMALLRFRDTRWSAGSPPACRGDKGRGTERPLSHQPVRGAASRRAWPRRSIGRRLSSQRKRSIAIFAGWTVTGCWHPIRPHPISMRNLTAARGLGFPSRTAESRHRSMQRALCGRCAFRGRHAFTPPNISPDWRMRSIAKVRGSMLTRASKASSKTKATSS